MMAKIDIAIYQVLALIVAKKFHIWIAKQYNREAWSEMYNKTLPSLKNNVNYLQKLPKTHW